MGIGLPHWMLLAALFICIFIFMDARFTPRSGKKYVVLDEDRMQNNTTRQKSYYYYLYVSSHKLTVGKKLYETAEPGDTIIVRRSILTHAVETIEMEKSGFAYVYAEGYMTFGAGSIIVPFTVLAIIIIMIVYRKIPEERGRFQIRMALFIISIVEFLYYIFY